LEVLREIGMTNVRITEGLTTLNQMTGTWTQKQTLNPLKEISTPSCASYTFYRNARENLRCSEKREVKGRGRGTSGSRADEMFLRWENLFFVR
jgi:hypothetical protein